MHWNLPSVTDEEREYAEELWNEFGFPGDDLTPMLRLLRSLHAAWNEGVQRRVADALGLVIPCLDCEVDLVEIEEKFMVRDEVWAAAQLRPESGWICIECLEARLGRRLTRDDFKQDVGMTTLEHYPRSERLKDRLGLPR